MKKICSFLILPVFCFFFMFIIAGCSNTQINMYDVQTNSIISLSLEEYVAGVTAAEIDESFAESAIEAQSIVARTFAIWFVQNKKSKYAGADISNDITEAQAYTSKIPEKIKTACNNTKGKILTYNGEIILPYYCSNAGGKTSLPSDVFDTKLEYYHSVDSYEDNDNSKNFYWQAKIEKSTILYAMQKLGKNLASINTFEIGRKDDSNRALTFIIGGQEVNANDFRLTVGSTIMKSCLITKIAVNNSSITLEGKGYGHGVGLSQYGANILANNNKDYNNILLYFFKNCKIEDL